MEKTHACACYKTHNPLTPSSSIIPSLSLSRTGYRATRSAVITMAEVKDCKQRQQQQNLLIMEVKVLSARSLKGPTSLLSGRLRPYVILSSATASNVTRELDEPPPFPSASVDAAERSGVLYRTRVDENGGENPTWGDTIHLPLDPSFLHPSPGSNIPAVHLLVLSKRRLPGSTWVGWCRIPASDVVDGFRPPCSVSRLSYSLRNCQHGGKGHGVVDVAVRLVGPTVSSPLPPARAAAVVPDRELPRVKVLGVPPASGWAGEVAIGIPVQVYGFAETATGRKERGRRPKN